MIWHLAKKEFLLNIISVRFTIGFLLCLLLIPFTIMVNIDDFRNQQRIYGIDSRTALENLQGIRVYSAFRPEIIKPPESLGIFCRGIAPNMGNKVRINFGEKSIFPEGKISLRDNPFLNSFFSIDFISVISILISLLALVFSYDLFTREREEGTLRLALSGGIGRTTFATGKLLGVFITLVPILVFCYLLGFLIILISGDVSFSGVEWMNIFILFFVSLFYMAVFVLTGSALSALVRHSSTSIVIGLLCWIWFVFLVPAIINYGVESFVKTELYENVQYAENEIDREYQGIHAEKYMDVLHESGLRGTTWWNADGGEDGHFETSGTPLEVMEFERKMREWSEPVRIEYADRKWNVQKDYLDGLIRQEKWQHHLSWLSPSTVFEGLATGLCRTGPDAFLDYMDQVHTYREVLINHFTMNGWFGSLRYITAQPPDKIATFEEYDKITESGNIPDCWTNHNNPVLDLNGVPMFDYRESTLIDMIDLGLTRTIALLAGSLLLFMLTLRLFSRYDIR